MFLNTQIRRLRSPLAVRLFGGAAWSLVGSVAASGFTLIAMMFVARMLGKQEYGKLIAVQSTLGMVGTFAGFGIGSAATRYAGKLGRSDPIRLGKILALTERTALVISGIGVTALALGSRAIASGSLNAPELALPLSIAAISVLFSSIDGYQKSVLIGIESMKVLAFGSVVAAFISIPILLILAALFGLNGAVAGLAVSALIQAVVSRVQMNAQLKLAHLNRIGPGCLEEWRVLRDFAFPAFLAGILVTPAHWRVQTMLLNTSNGYANVALLGVAMQWFNAAMFVPNVAGRVLLPVLAQQLGGGESNRAGKILKYTIVANLAFALPLAIVLSAVSPWIMGAYGSQFRDGALSLSIIAFVACLAVSAAPLGQFLAAENRMWTGATMNFGWALLYLTAAAALVGNGTKGIVSAMGIAYLGHSIWVGAFVWRRLRRLNTPPSKLQASSI